MSEPTVSIPAAPTSLPRLGYRLPEVSEMLGVAESTLLDLIRAGQLECHRFGTGLRRKRILVTPAQIEAFLARTKLVVPRRRSA